jgi:hypothetical protein
MADSFNYNLIAYIGREPDFLKEVIIEWPDENTPVITFWDATALGKAQPTIDQLKALDTQATTLENNDKVRNTRKVAYGDIGDQLDLLYKDMLAGKGDSTGEWFKKIKAVKDANAKE